MFKTALDTELFEELKARLPQSIVKQNEPLAKKTTLRVGGPADLYLEPSSEDDLARAVRFAAENEIPFRLLGRGSNLLVRDGGIRGLVISLSHSNFSTIEPEGNLLRCGAGAKLKNVSAKARELLLTGLEFLEGIPGSVGGALRMNAGAMGSATFEVLTHLRWMDSEGRVAEAGVEHIACEYRSCPFFKDHIALGGVFEGEPATRAQIAERTKSFNEKRWSSQPKEPSAGCIFKNPTVAAGKLIEELGLKSQRIGGAMVSPIHGNFIVNDGGATASDVLQLIELIQDKVRNERGIELRTEVEIVGENL